MCRGFAAAVAFLYSKFSNLCADVAPSFICDNSSLDALAVTPRNCGANVILLQIKARERGAHQLCCGRGEDSHPAAASIGYCLSG